MSDARAAWRDATAEEIDAAAIRKAELRRQLAELQQRERGLVNDAVTVEDRT